MNIKISKLESNETWSTKNKNNGNSAVGFDSNKHFFRCEDVEVDILDGSPPSAISPVMIVLTPQNNAR